MRENLFNLVLQHLILYDKHRNNDLNNSVKDNNCLEMVQQQGYDEDSNVADIHLVYTKCWSCKEILKLLGLIHKT